VLLKEVDQAALDRGLATIRKNYEVTMSKGKMTAEPVERTLALITPTTTYDGFDQVDIVTEAVFENMDLKKATFAELGKVTRPDCILASNSSTLDIDQFAQASGRPALAVMPSSASSRTRSSSRPRGQLANQWSNCGSNCGSERFEDNDEHHGEQH
jgi:3-hydroxyacyl-CoA dehydrogenase